MRGLKRLRCARVIGTGHAFIQNLRRGHYNLGHDADPGRRLSAAFTELALAIGPKRQPRLNRFAFHQRNCALATAQDPWLKLINLSGRLHNRTLTICRPVAITRWGQPWQV